MKSNFGAAAPLMGIALLASLIAPGQALAGFFYVPPPIPEIDGPAGIAAIALLVGVVAILYQKIRK